MTEEEIAISRSTPRCRFDVAGAAAPACGRRRRRLRPTRGGRGLRRRTAVADREPVVMFALEWCEFCWSVRKLFAGARHSLPLDRPRLGRVPEGRLGRPDPRGAARAGPASPTIPQIFVGGEHHRRLHRNVRRLQGGPAADAAPRERRSPSQRRARRTPIRSCRTGSIPDRNRLCLPKQRPARPGKLEGERCQTNRRRTPANAFAGPSRHRHRGTGRHGILPLRVMPVVVGGTGERIHASGRPVRCGSRAGAEHVGSFRKTEKSVRQWCTRCGGHLMTGHPTSD